MKSFEDQLHRECPALARFEGRQKRLLFESAMPPNIPPEASPLIDTLMKMIQQNGNQVPRDTNGKIDQQANTIMKQLQAMGIITRQKQDGSLSFGPPTNSANVQQQPGAEGGMPQASPPAAAGPKSPMGSSTQQQPQEPWWVSAQQQQQQQGQMPPSAGVVKRPGGPQNMPPR